MTFFTHSFTLGQNLVAASWEPPKWVNMYGERRRAKVSVNNSQLPLRTPPWVAHTNRLDKFNLIGFRQREFQTS